MARDGVNTLKSEARTRSASPSASDIITPGLVGAGAVGFLTAVGIVVAAQPDSEHP